MLRKSGLRAFEDPFVRIIVIQKRQILLELITKEIRNTDFSYGALRFRSAHDIFSVMLREGLIYTNGSSIEINVISCERQHFTFTETAPVEDLIAVIEFWIHHSLVRKLLILVYSPELDALILYTHVLDICQRIRFQIPLAVGVVDNRIQLALNGPKVCF